MDRPQFTLDQLIKEANREAKMRETVYTKKVRDGSMTPADARRKLDMMREIAGRLQQLSGLLYPAAPTGSLFELDTAPQAPEA